MRILLINKFYHVRGGADRYFFETAGILTQHGHEVIPFSTVHLKNKSTPYAKYFSRIGATEDDLSSMSVLAKMRLFLNGIYSFEAARQLEWLIRDTRPDIAHVHNILYQLTPSIFPVLHRHNIPVVQSLHDWHIICGGAYLYTKGSRCERCKGGRFFHCALHKCYRNSFGTSLMASLSKYADNTLDLWKSGADAFTVPAQHMVDRLSAWGFQKSRIHIIPNPFHLDGLKPTFQAGDYVVWYGRLLRLKGIYTVLQAAKELPHIRFEMYGSGPEEANAHAYIANNGLKNVFLDTTTRWGPELQNQITNALCVVEPSDWYQPSQYVIWEAFALGKGILATNIGGTPDMVDEGINGSMFEPGNATQLARAITRLSENRNLAIDWGKAARSKVEKMTDTFYDRLMEIYQLAREVRRGRT